MSRSHTKSNYTWNIDGKMAFNFPYKTATERCAYIDHNGRCDVCGIVCPAIVAVFRWPWGIRLQINRIWVRDIEQILPIDCISSTLAVLQYTIFLIIKDIHKWFEFEMDTISSINHLIWLHNSPRYLEWPSVALVHPLNWIHLAVALCTNNYLAHRPWIID